MEKILILDFGSQYTQLIARRIRELQVYCEILPYHRTFELGPEIKGVVLSGSPFSVRDAQAPYVELEKWRQRIPILGICYGAQLIAHRLGGEVAAAHIREYGRAQLHIDAPTNPLLAAIPDASQVWMSHADSILQLPAGFRVLAHTESIPIAAYQIDGEPTFGIQFHPEVTHTTEGKQLLANFVLNICGCKPSWTPDSFVEQSISQLRQLLGNERVVMALSGGVDSTVAATLLHRAIGQQLYCIFVDNGLLRKNEFKQVLEGYQELGLNVRGIDAQQRFYSALRGLSEPEAKRKAIGRTFIEVFEEEAQRIEGVRWLGQGTIYPDVIESVSVNGPSVTIKSHHNVGGLPERMQLKVVEPLRSLFKDEVRAVGHALQLPASILGRHPFPGPGLAIRILGEVTPEKVQLLQEADDIYIQALRRYGWYEKVWQAGAILLPVYSVGVMGDERTYEQVVALRAVHSSDGMTADWAHLPYELMAEVANNIINQVKGINRVVYDISSKPPATIEWE